MDHQKFRIPCLPLGYETVDQSEIRVEHLERLAKNAIKEVLKDPESVLIKFEEIKDVFRDLEPNNFIQHPVNTFNALITDQLENCKDLVKNALTSNDTSQIKKAVGITRFIGHLFNVCLVFPLTLHDWMTKVLVGGSNKFIMLNLMEIVKEMVIRLLGREEADDMELKEIIQLITDENLYDEVESSLNSYDASMDDEDKVDFSNQLMNKIIQSPSTMSSQAQLYKDIRALDRNFEKIFSDAMSERLNLAKNQFDFYINFTWIQSFRAELCLIDVLKADSFIKLNAKGLLFKSREETLLFVIIFHKLSNKLRREAPETFNMYVNYLKQLMNELPKDITYWEPNEENLSDLSSKIYHKQLDKFSFEVDEHSLDRAKLIFKCAFDERDYIAKTLYRMSDSLGLRLLKIHLSFLCKIKFVTEEFELDLQENRNDPKNIRTTTFVELVGKFYEFDVVNGQTVMEILNHLMNVQNINVIVIFCTTVFDKFKNERDLIFESSKNYMRRVCEAMDENENRNEPHGKATIEFKNLVRHLEESKIEAFNFQQLQKSNLTTYASFLISEASSDEKLSTIAPKLCKKITQVHLDFKNVLENLLMADFDSTIEKFGENRLIVKFDATALLTAYLMKDFYLDGKVMRKFTSKSRAILSPHENIEDWKKFLYVFKIVSKMSCWISNEDLNEFLICMDFFYDTVNKNISRWTSFAVENFLIDFDDQIKPAINAANANPSFKRQVHKIITRSEPITKNWMKIPVQWKVKDVQACAEYFVINAVSCAQIDDFVYFLSFLEGGFCGDFESDSKILIPEVNKIVIKLFEDQHTKRKGYEDGKKTMRTARFASMMFLHDLMPSDEIKTCFEMICDSIGTEINKINAECLHDFMFNVREEFKPKVDPFVDFLMVETFEACDSRRDLIIVDVPNSPLTFDDLKRHKAVNYAQMITDSALKIENTAEKYYEMIVRILKARPTFKVELKQRIKEITAFQVYAPFVKNLKWKEIKNFGMFLACLYTNKLLEHPQIESFFDVLNKRVFGFRNGLQKEMKEFAKLFIEVAKKYPKMMKEENIRSMDALNCFIGVIDGEYDSKVREFINFFNKTLSFKESFNDVFPSFKYFIDNIIKGCDHHEYFFQLQNPVNEGRFFFDQALKNCYGRIDALMENLLVIKRNDYGPALVDEVVKLSDIGFDIEFRVRVIKEAAQPIAVSQVIAKLFLKNLYPLSKYLVVLRKICELTLAKPSMCHIMCFHNVAMPVKDLKSMEKEKENIKKVIEFIEERILLTDLEFNNDNLDGIDCEEMKKKDVVGEGPGRKIIITHLKFELPKPTAPDFNFDLNDSEEFKKFIAQLTPDENLTNFKCPKIKKDLYDRYAFILVSKLNMDSKFARVIAEVCGKITKKNEKFPETITKVSEKLFALLLSTKKSIVGFLEFITMLNVLCECWSCFNLIKFAFFRVFEEGDWIYEDPQNFPVIEEFLHLNEKKIARYRWYIISDIYFQMKTLKMSDTNYYDERLKKVDLTHKSVKNDQANPSLNFIIRHVIEKQNNHFKLYEDPRDLRILNPLESVKFFLSKLIDAPKPTLYADIIMFTNIHSPYSKNLKIFTEIVVNHAKAEFYKFHIEGFERSDEIKVKRNAELLSELYRQSLMEYKDYKIIWKLTIDNYMSNDNPILDECYSLIYEKGLIGKKFPECKKDDHAFRFINTCIGIDLNEQSEKTRNRKKVVKRKGKVERPVLKMPPKRSEEVVQATNSGAIPKKQNSPYDHPKAFQTFKSSVESLEFDINQFNFSIPNSNLPAYVDYALKTLLTSSDAFAVYFVLICKEFREKFNDLLFTEMMKKLQNEKEKIGKLLALLYNHDMLTTLQIESVLKIFFENDIENLYSVLRTSFRPLCKKDPQIFYFYADKLLEMHQKDETVEVFDAFNDDSLNIYPSFKNLVRTIEEDEEYFTSNIKIHNAKECADYIFKKAIKSVENAEKFAHFLANPPDELDIRLLAFEVITKVVTEFEDFSKTELQFEEQASAGAFLAELHKNDLIGFRTIEDIMKHLERSSKLAQMSAMHFSKFRIYRRIMRRIYHKVKNCDDIEMKKYFAPQKVTALGLGCTSDEKLLIIEDLNEFLKSDDILNQRNTEERDLTINFLNGIKENDKEKMLEGLRDYNLKYKIDKTLKMIASAMAMFAVKSKIYNETFMDFLKILPSNLVDPVLIRKSFKQIIDEYYEEVFKGRTKEENKSDKRFGIFVMELANNSVINPDDVISIWHKMSKKNDENLIKLMKLADQKIYDVRDESTIVKLEYLRDKLLKDVKPNANYSKFLNLMKILKKFEINAVKIAKEMEEIKIVKEVEVEAQTKKRKRNKKKKGGKSEDQESANNKVEDNESKIDPENLEETKNDSKNPEKDIKDQMNQNSKVNGPENSKSTPIAPNNENSKFSDRQNQNSKPNDPENNNSKPLDQEKFDIDSFKLMLKELECCTSNQILDKIKSIKIDSKKCLKLMAKEFLDEISQNYREIFIFIAKLMDENFIGFREVLEMEIMGKLSEKLIDGFGEFEVMEIDFEAFKIEENLTIPDETEEIQAPVEIKKKKKTVKKAKKKNVAENDEQQENLSEKSKIENQKEIWQKFNNEVVRFQNLLDFGIKLFNIGWISIENFQKLFEFLMARENFKTASKVLKETSLRLTKEGKKLKINFENYPKSIFEHFNYLSIMEQIQLIEKAAQDNLKNF